MQDVRSVVGEGCGGRGVWWVSGVVGEGCGGARHARNTEICQWHTLLVAHAHGN